MTPTMQSIFVTKSPLFGMRITRLHIFLRLGSRFTLITSDTNMAIEATMWKLIIIDNFLSGIGIILNRNARHF